MTPQDVTPDRVPPAELLRQWLIERAARHLSPAPQQIRVDVPLAEYGLDSVSATGLAGEIEERWGLVVEPSLLWDHPTVAELADAVSRELSSATHRAAPPA